MRDTDTGLVESNNLKEEPQEKVKVGYLRLVGGMLVHKETTFGPQKN